MKRAEVEIQPVKPEGHSVESSRASGLRTVIRNRRINRADGARDEVDPVCGQIRFPVFINHLG